MQKNIGVYVTKRHLKSNLWNQECELHTNRVTSKDGSTKYGEKAKDLAVQYNSKVDTVECACKTSRPKHCHESSSRYIITTSSPGYRSRSYVETGAGSVRKLPKKRIRKVYLPEKNDQAVGSTDMTSYIRRNRQPNYNYCNQNKKMSSKCVGGFNEITPGRVVSEKLSPISMTESYSTSPSLPRSDMRKRTITLKDKEIGSGIINNQLASASVQVENIRRELKTTLAGNSTTNQFVTATTQFEETKREYESKNSVRRTPTKYVLSEHTDNSNSQSSLKSPVEVRTEKILSSDTVVQVHNLEINSEMNFVKPTEPYGKMNEEVQEKKINENHKKDSVIEEGQMKESVLEVDASNESKEANVKTANVLKNTSMLRRRFEALRRSLCRKEETKKVVKTPSHHTPVSRMSSRSQVNSLINVSIGIASDPPSLVARSYGELSIGPNTTSKHSSKKSIPQEKQESSNDVSSSKYNSLDSETSQGVKGMFKLWGKKFNLEGNPEVEGKYASSSVKSRSKVEEESIDEQPAPKEREKKRFFFFRSKVKENKKPKEKEDDKLKPEFKSKQKITIGRSEVTGGFSVSSGASRKKSIMAKKESVKRKESPGELLRQEWLMKYSTNPKESNKSITLRWNNGAFPTSSSTLNLTEKSYDTDSLLRSASGLTVSDSPVTSSPFSQKLQHVNYLQMYQAWMIPQLILNRPIIPSKSENYGRNMEDVEVLDRQWFIDKSKAFAHQLELILHTKNVTRFNRKVSSEYITIDIPKDFFSDCSTGNNSPVYPIRLSDEEVYNIVEYETPINSEIMKKNKHNISNADQTVQGTRFTESIENKIDERPQKIDKDQPKFKDIETQRSADCDLNNVLGVRIITQRELREARKPKDICMESDYSYNMHAQNSETKCGFAESYLQEYYQKWMSMDLISWCMSYPKFKCYSLKDSRKSFSNDEGTKSCPNIHEEFFTPTFMSRSNIISTYSPYYNVQTEKVSHDNVKSVKFLPRNRSSRIRIRDVGRVIPKDSLEVLKKRKINATRKNWASMENPEKKSDTEGTNKKRVSLGVDEIIKEILTPVASRKLTSKRSLPSNNRSDSFSLVSDPETVSTRSPEASERSLKCSAVNAKRSEKTLHSSTPRLSPKQSHPKVSCSGLKMGVMGILLIESSRHTLSSVDCLRSSVSKMSFHDSDQSKKYSVHIVQSQQNNPVSSLVKLSNSQSLPLVVIESFESDASKCFATHGTNKASLYDTESKCVKTLAPITDEFKPFIQEQKTNDQMSKNLLTPKEETVKQSSIDKSENYLKTKDNENRQEIIQNISDLLKLKSELEKENSKDESKNQLKSNETKSKEIITKHINDLLTSNVERAIAISQNKAKILLSQDKEMKRITKNVEDLHTLNIESAKAKGTDKPDFCLISSEPILKVKNTHSETKLLTAVEYPTCKSLSKNTTLSHKTSALSLSWKMSGGMSARKMYSIEQNVFHENQRINKISDCNISMKTQHKDVIQINSHEKITVEVKNINSSIEIAHDCKDNKETNKSSAEIKHEVNLWKESEQKQDVLSMFTHKESRKTFDNKIKTKENQLQKKSELSIANIIEIDFKLKVTNGDNSTEVHIGNDGNNQNKINVMQASHESQGVLVMNANDSKYPINEFVTMDANGNKDINIKIMIKNFKNKTNSGIGKTTQKASKNYIGFPNNTSERFQTIAASQSSELIYSTHKATIDLTGKSGELIAFNNNISHHLSDIIMLSKINTSESYMDVSDIKSVTETRKKKMSLFGKITGRTKERFGKGHKKLSSSKRSRSDTLASENEVGTETSVRTKERFGKGHKKLSSSKRSRSDTLASENEVGTETSVDVYSKESNHSKSIKNLDKKVMGLKTSRRIDDTIKISSELPSEHASRSKYQEKKELLKKVFQTANCLGKRKTKSRVRKLKTILKSILTSDSSDQDLARHHDLLKDITDVSLSMKKSSFTSLNSILNAMDHRKPYNKKHKTASSADGASENDSVLESHNKCGKGCACSTVAEKFNLCGAMGLKGCCCGKPITKYEAKHEETNCNLANEGRQSPQISKTKSPVIVETQNFKNDVCKPNNSSEQAYSNHQLNTHVSIVDKPISKETIIELIEPSAKSVSTLEEPEITVKAIENSQDVEVPIVKSEETVNENIENVINESVMMDDREIISVQDENVDLTNNENKKEDIIVRNVETTVCKPSRESKKIVITIDQSKKKNEEPKITRKNYDKACISNSNNIRPCAFKMLDRNTKLGISDDDKIIFLEPDSKNVKANLSQCTESQRQSHKKREETNELVYNGTDILQLYETKKAVLQIYAEKRRTVYGEKIVADLPAFMANKESEIYRNYGDLVKHAYCNVCKNVM